MNCIVYTNTEGNLVVVHPTQEALEILGLDEIISKDVPADVDYKVIDSSLLPDDRVFRACWKLEEESVTVQLEDAKEESHRKRRLARSQEFAPLDVKATIPVYSVEAEEDRQGIRQKYADLQVAIDATTTVDELKQVASEVL